MEILSASNPRMTENGVRLDVVFDGIGPVCFHAVPDDVEEHGRLLYGRAMAGEFGTPEPLVIEQETASVPESITPRQGYIILARYSLLAPVKSYFQALTGEDGEIARIELEYASEWRRDWPSLVAAATAFGLSSGQIDQMFIEAAQL